MKAREGYYSEQNRNHALNNVLDDLSKRQKAVYDIIKKWQPITNERIADHLNVYPHQVTPRVKELRDMNIVEYCGFEIVKKDDKEYKHSLWRINPDGSQLNLF